MPRKEYYQKNLEKSREANKKASKKFRENKIKNDPNWYEQEKQRLQNLPSTLRRSKIRWQVLKRDNFTCQYCGRKAPDVVLNVDHKIPQSKGGKYTVENLITACWDCNIGKGTDTL